MRPPELFCLRNTGVRLQALVNVSLLATGLGGGGGVQYCPCFRPQPLPGI